MRKSRSKGLRVKTGCKVCRSRHVKCDEARPVCRPCQRGNRDCHYPDERQSGQSISDATDDSVGQHITEPIQSNSATSIPSLVGQTDDRIEHPVAGTTQETPSGSSDGHQVWKDPSTIPPVCVGPAMNSPESHASGASGYSTQHAPLRWLRLLTRDTPNIDIPQASLPQGITGRYDNQPIDQISLGLEPRTSGGFLHSIELEPCRPSNEHQASDLMNETPPLTAYETELLKHFVQNLSSWIDLTDPKRSFSTIVPHMALKNEGLMKAILALSSRHLSLQPVTDRETRPNREMAVQYYNETLQYLQAAMQHDAYLRSEELLSTVLIVSTYEMVDGSDGGWERHLKGVFGIQRSQLIHGESGGLKQAIWWAWLRQDLWAAFRERRKIMSFYTLAKPCRELDRWELANRAFYLLGQCVNFASEAELSAGKVDVQTRVSRAEHLSTSLDEWWCCFAPYRVELPTWCPEERPFRPIWIHPPFCSAAVQVHNFARLLVAINRPATSGLNELLEIQRTLNATIDYIGGVACTTTDCAATIVSTQCLLAACFNTSDLVKKGHLLELLLAHQARTGWPSTNSLDEVEEEIRYRER